ncbi:polysaccharide biosynthesis protein [Ectobacillus ponti]|uniref:Polysaccharide biosynthesis protein n=1 Tax=Ectobacillus ponti TaxID=2961894 RepID=A0AA42BSD7_9BACI|nr:polysaccharide biosynthesis protein [Ectobacillus ponti]MCP8968338.1 polysaccharide biosynthesis protein [Ectobacillus ponti]
MFENQTILITGGTGSWGYELTRRLLTYQPKEIRVFSRSEDAQVRMLRAFNHNPLLKFVIGDVRDFQAVTEACKGVNYVFHLAALKHVPICEEQPYEAIKTNIAGTEHIIRASILHGVEKVINVSTDKAVNPVNLYGLTKAIGEKLITQANFQSEKTKFVSVRGGNVLGTNGSVVPFFKKQILEGKDVTLTSQSMTRFFLTVSDSIDLLVKAAEISSGGEIFVMKMSCCRIADLAKVLIRNFSQTEVNIQEVGVRLGEKLHEALLTKYESTHSYQYMDQYFIILPAHLDVSDFPQYKDLPKVALEEYESTQDLMTEEQIEKLLQRGGFLL